MVKIFAKAFKKKLEKNPYLPIILIILFLVLFIVAKLGFDYVVEHESVCLNHNNKDNLNQFARISDSQINSSYPLILQRVDSDIRPLLAKYFGPTKFDRDFLINSSATQTWHLFYFTQHSPRLEEFQTEFIPAFANLGYIQIANKDERTYDYDLNFQGNTYQVLIDLLSYNGKDSTGVVMVYIHKLN